MNRLNLHSTDLCVIYIPQYENSFSHSCTFSNHSIQRALYTSSLWNPLVVSVEMLRAQVGKSLNCEALTSCRQWKLFKMAENRPASILGKTRFWFIQGSDVLELAELPVSRHFWNTYFPKTYSAMKKKPVTAQQENRDDRAGRPTAQVQLIVRASVSHPAIFMITARLISPKCV